MYEALVARVRYHIQKAEFMGLKEAESTLLLKETAGAIEELSKQFDNMNEANIALYGALPKWISVEDDLPEVPDGEMFSKGVYVTDGTEIDKACIMRTYDGATGWTYTGIGKITHWCEQIQLQETPKEET